MLITCTAILIIVHPTCSNIFNIAAANVFDIIVLLLHLLQLDIIQQQTFLLMLNDNFSSIGSNLNWQIIVLFIILFLKNFCVYSHFFFFIVFNMILKQLFLFSLHILFNFLRKCSLQYFTCFSFKCWWFIFMFSYPVKWLVTSGFYINLFWYTALVQPLGGTLHESGLWNTPQILPLSWFSLLHFLTNFTTVLLSVWVKHTNKMCYH